MDFVRVLDPLHYDTKKRRFIRLAFRDNGEGISVFDEQCAVAASEYICRHISRFYGSVSGTPAIFWKFPGTLLPNTTTVTGKVSTTGDTCHFDLTTITESEANAVFKQNHLASSFVCDDPHNPRRIDLNSDHEMLSRMRAIRDEDIARRRAAQA